MPLRRTTLNSKPGGAAPPWGQGLQLLSRLADESCKWSLTGVSARSSLREVLLGVPLDKEAPNVPARNKGIAEEHLHSGARYHRDRDVRGGERDLVRIAIGVVTAKWSSQAKCGRARGDGFGKNGRMHAVAGVENTTEV